MIFGRLGWGVVAALGVGGCNAKVEPQRRHPRVATPTPEPAVASAKPEPVPPAKTGPKPGPDEPGYSPEMTTGVWDDERFPGPYHMDIQPHHQPALLAGTVYVESKKVEAMIAGCADGQREGFADVDKYPSIAGCLGDWDGHENLQAPPSGTPCGDDLGKCTVPADTCAAGWHVCGSPDGLIRDLTARIGPDDCDAAGPGRFNAGLGHDGGDDVDGCIPDTHDYLCLSHGFSSEPVCCGQDCEFGMCRDGVWAGRTRISRGLAEGCRSLSAARNGGVLCCTDVAM